MTQLRIAEGLTLPLEAVTELDLAWAAGLFEGEGCISIGVRNSDETYRLICIIGSTDRETIEFFHRRWGGYFQRGFGKQPNHKPSWTWTLIGPKAAAFLAAIQPHVRTQKTREKLELGIRFQSGRLPGGTGGYMPGYKEGQRQIYQTMRRLNRRGVPVETPA